jgi:lysophospholipase L1-like esterase
LTKVSILGDSISTYTGCNPAGWNVYYDVDFARELGMEGVQDTWWARVLAACGWDLCSNASFSGSLVSGAGFPSATSPERIEAIAAEDGTAPELILVYIGINDFGFCAPDRFSRAEEPSDVRYFYDAYAIMLDKLLERYPQTGIVCATLMGTSCGGLVSARPSLTNEMGIALGHFNDSIRTAAERAGQPIADLEEMADPADPTKPRTYDSIDGVHPTRAGHEQLAAAWVDALEALGMRNPVS